MIFVYVNKLHLYKMFWIPEEMMKEDQRKQHIFQYKLNKSQKLKKKTDFL